MCILRTGHHWINTPYVALAWNCLVTGMCPYGKQKYIFPYFLGKLLIKSHQVPAAVRIRQIPGVLFFLACSMAHAANECTINKWLGRWWSSNQNQFISKFIYAWRLQCCIHKLYLKIWDTKLTNPMATKTYYHTYYSLHDHGIGMTYDATYLI